jgi:hypothetical protein
MKRLIIVATLLCASLAYAANRGDTVYNQRGQGVQGEAPNYFETFADSAVNHTVDLSAYGGTLYWSLYAPSGCQVKVTATSSRAGTPFTILSGARDGLVKGYGMGFVHFSSCALGEYRSMRGDWQGQQ